MSYIDFYKNLPPKTKLSEIFQERFAAPVPDDWHIAVADIIGSTRVITSGEYKVINITGGLAVMAVSNALGDMELPFIFRGDGVVFLVPDEARNHIADILIDTSEYVQKIYGLELRVGMVPIRVVKDRGHAVALAKLRVSEYYNQAIIRGYGMERAEELVKSKTTDAYHIKTKNDPSVKADFSGFTCRWDDIKSPRGETISLIIRARNPSLPPRELNELYGRILAKIEELFGDESHHHPLNEENLRVISDEDFLAHEAMALAGTTSGLAYRAALLRVTAESYAMRLAIRLGLGLKAFWYDLSRLKNYQILSCDFQKYDGTLRMVLACSTRARIEFEAYLKELHDSGSVFYGLHISDRALMTCVLHESSRRETHFVDAADGGFSLATRQLQTQMREALKRTRRK